MQEGDKGGLLDQNEWRIPLGQTDALWCQVGLEKKDCQKENREAEKHRLEETGCNRSSQKIRNRLK